MMYPLANGIEISVLNVEVLSEKYANGFWVGCRKIEGK